MERQKILSLLRAQLDIFPFVNVKRRSKSIGHVEFTDSQYMFISFSKKCENILETQRTLDFLVDNNLTIDIYDEFK